MTYATGCTSLTLCDPTRCKFLDPYFNPIPSSPRSRLERVILTSNKIGKIPPPLMGQTLGVKHLSLSFNRLESWADVDALSAWCPALNTLTLNGNPLFDGVGKLYFLVFTILNILEDPILGRNSRQLTIARIPTLVALDAAPVGPPSVSPALPRSSPTWPGPGFGQRTHR